MFVCWSEVAVDVCFWLIELFEYDLDILILLGIMV